MEYTECRALPSWLGQGARGRRQRTQRARRARRTRRTRRTGTRGPARGNARHPGLRPMCCTRASATQVAAAWQGGSQFRFSIKRASPFHPKPAARNIDDLLFDIIVLRVHGQGLKPTILKHPQAFCLAFATPTCAESKSHLASQLIGHLVV